MSCRGCGETQNATNWRLAMGAAHFHRWETRSVEAAERPITGHYLINQLTTLLSPTELRERGPKGPHEFH